MMLANRFCSGLSASSRFGIRFLSSSRVCLNEDSLFSGIVNSSGQTNEFDSNKRSADISNVLSPTGKDSGKKNVIKPNERTVKYVLNCLFGKNNTHFTYNAVVEDTNYMKLNSNKSYNEQFLYYLNLPRKVKFSISTGSLGFRKAARGEYEAAFQTASKVFQMIKEKRMMDKDIEIVMKDFGKGRSAFIAALNGKEGNNIRKNITRVSDNTSLKFGGVRAPRVRRL